MLNSKCKCLRVLATLSVAQQLVCAVDQTEELRYKYVIVELFGADCLSLFTTILQVCSKINVKNTFRFITTYKAHRS